MNKFFEELKKATDDFPDEYKRILMSPPREQMRFGIMLANAQLDYILSGEWKDAHRRKKYTKRI